MGPPPPGVPVIEPFHVVAALVTLAAAFAYVNHRYLWLHPTVGIMAQAIAVAVGLRLLAGVWPRAAAVAVGLRHGVDLNAALFHWMLGPLLFAGALRVDLHQLRAHRTTVAVLAVLGTVVSTAVVAGLTYALLRLAGAHPPVLGCAVFGAVVSPTDPVAVLGFLKAAAAPPDIEAVIAGESLFNDGVGIVLFTVLVGLLGGGHATAGGVALAFARQAAGGVAVGLAAARLVYHLLRRVDDYPVEVLLTVALAVGGYALADVLGTSGALAAVTAGLVIGSHGRAFAVSDRARRHLDDFWELVEEALNAVLFLIVGLVAIQTRAGWPVVAIQAAAVAVALLARWVSVVVSTRAVALRRVASARLRPHTVAVLTWGGLRGGLAVAMALSLPPGPERTLIVPATYAVVVFAVTVQGGTLPWLFRRWLGPASATEPVAA